MLSTNQAVKSDFVQTMLALVHCRLGIILQMTEQHSGINLPTSRASICRSLMTAQHTHALHTATGVQVAKSYSRP